MKKFIAKLLIIACLVTSVGQIPQLNVQAATTQSSTEIISVAMGTTYEIPPQESVVEWSSSHPGIASVDENGIVTAIVNDTQKVTITGTHEDGTTETYTFKVLAPLIKKTQITLDQEEQESISFTSGYEQITCVSDDPSIVEVRSVSSSMLTIKGHCPGETTLRIQSKQASYELQVTVNSTFKFNNEEMDLLNTVTESYLTLPADFDSYVWENSNPEVLGLEPYRQYKYKMVPKGVGDAVITVTNEYGQVAKVTVHVFQSITSLDFEESRVTIYLGSTYQLKYQAVPSLEETNNRLKFICYDDEIEVTETGLVIPKKTGSSVWVYMYAIDSKSDSDRCTIDVKMPYFSQSSYSMYKFATLNLAEMLTGGSENTVWTSSNEAIAKVDENGVVTGVGAGTATITANCGGYKITTNVQVKKASLSKTSATIYKGDTTTLKLTGAVGKVTWKSSKTSVATVNSSGKVTAKKAGTATITATANGEKFTCKVTVKGPTLNYTKKSLIAKQTYTLKVKGATGKVTWKSLNTSVATVNSSGKITAKKAGTATITAKVDGKTLKCKVTVKANQKTYSVNKDVTDYSYGEPAVVLSKVYYSGSSLKADAYVMNNRMFRAEKFTWLRYKIYDSNGNLVASKKFTNIKLGIKPYGYKKITLTFSGSSLKKKNAILNNGVGTDWSYYYIYSY